VTITRGGIGTGAPSVDVTNAQAAVTSAVSSYTIGGTNNAHVRGTMTWTNAASGATGVFAANGTWEVAGIALSLGRTRSR